MGFCVIEWEVKHNFKLHWVNIQVSRKTPPNLENIYHLGMLTGKVVGSQSVFESPLMYQEVLGRTWGTFMKPILLSRTKERFRWIPKIVVCDYA